MSYRSFKLLDLETLQELQEVWKFPTDICWISTFPEELHLDDVIEVILAAGSETYQNAAWRSKTKEDLNK